MSFIVVIGTVINVGWLLKSFSVKVDLNLL